MNDKLLANARFYFAQSVFNSSCHYKAYARLAKKKKQISYIIISLSAVTALILILQIIGFEQKSQNILNIAAHISLLITGISLIFELYNKEDNSHEIFLQKLYAERYKSLRDQFMGLIEEIMSDSSSIEELRLKKNALLSSYSKVGEHSPETTSNDYRNAQKGLGLDGNSGEEFTWADKEIDKFLPEQLRLNK